eukprot:CAMPEP_0114246172 /NCGR_PEP_ID=MMETSP0058-20121206/12309_1 /TAXON_ID=36894 /ORGANISM="Pyramimonas parkeae, CCMP726" /LENGTH=350 /DNA_ID=CAMNT_0001359317 /DNA_START=587 /DNA_END=1640 /DNA_ORIENTATION=+
MAYATTSLVTLMMLLAQSTAAVRINETAAYQACIAAPATCTRMWLRASQLTGTIPTQLGTLTSITHIEIHTNQLTGTLPTELGALTRMTRMSFFFNWLTGTVPTELGALTRITHLGLGSLRLTGTVPTELGALTSMSWIDLFTNKLTGTLPTELGALTRLTEMNIYVNQISGTVPTELGALTGLKLMLFSTNQLMGTLPTELAALTMIQEMFMCNNPGLCGDIPAGVTLTKEYGYCSTATGGTLLGSACPSMPPPENASNPASFSDEQPLKANWFRKRDVARRNAFPQRFSWFLKQTKREAENNPPYKLQRQKQGAISRSMELACMRELGSTVLDKLTRGFARVVMIYAD